MATPTKSRTVPLTKRGLNFEMLMWIFTRLSALAMYALDARCDHRRVDYGCAHPDEFGGCIALGLYAQCDPCAEYKCARSCHLVVTVLENTCQPIAPGCHCTWGAWLVVICDDYIVKPLGRQIVRYISIVFMISMILIGIYVIWTS